MLLRAKEKAKAGKRHGGCLRGWGLSQGGQRKPHREGGIWMKAEVMRYWDGCLGEEEFQTERKMNSKAQRQDFPGGPVVKALPFHCWGYGFDLWRGWGIRSHMLVQCSQIFFLIIMKKMLRNNKRTGVLEEGQEAREAGMRWAKGRVHEGWGRERTGDSDCGFCSEWVEDSGQSSDATYILPG